MLALAVAVACSSPRNADRAATPAASERRSAVPGAQRPDGSYMLYSFPVSKSGDLTYEIVLAPCGDPACPLQVRLLAGETVVDTASVEWPSVVAAPKQTDRVAALTGVGDPLQLDRTVSTWQTGEGEDFVATLARAVPLGGDSTGVLVDQGGGAEHVKRLHYLFVANGRKLVEAWKGWEGQGLTSSTVDTMDIDNDGRVEALYWRFSSDDGVVSNWSLAVQRWNAEQARVDEVPAGSGPKLVAVVARTFSTAAAASKFFNDHSACLPSFLVMRAPAAQASGFAVAGITAHAPLAAEAERAVKTCDSTIDAKTMELGARNKSSE
jgi:hypothetical protein